MTSRIRILLLTQWFDPEPTFKGIVFARELVRQDFDVEVVTGFPNYPGGKVYPNYRIKLLQRELIDGVELSRVPLYPSHDQGAVGRVANYVSFALAALIYCLFSAKKPAVIYVYHPPLTVALAAVLVGFFRRVPVVCDIQDMWPDTLRATGMIENPRALAAVSVVCSWVYRRATHLVVLSPGFKRLLEQRGVPDEKVDVIYNWADEASLACPKGILPANFPGTAYFRIVFAGNIGKAQALHHVLDAAVLLQSRASRVCFVFLGGGVEVSRLKGQAQALGLSNVVFLSPVPMVEVGTILKAADVLLVHLRKDPLFRVTIPSKTQAYLAAGKPILMAVDGEAADLVNRANCGVIAESENAEAICSAAESLAQLSTVQLAELGKRAHTYYQEVLALSIGVAKFGTIFNRLALSAQRK